MRRHFKVIHKMSDKVSVKTSKELIRETQDPNRFRRHRQGGLKLEFHGAILKSPTPATQACPLPTVCQLTADTYRALSPCQSRGFHGDDDAFMSKQTGEVQGLIRENMMLRKLLSNMHSRNIHLQEAMLMDQSIRQMEDVLGMGVPPLPITSAPLVEDGKAFTDQDESMTEVSAHENMKGIAWDYSAPSAKRLAPPKTPTSTVDQAALKQGVWVQQCESSFQRQQTSRSLADPRYLSLAQPMMCSEKYTSPLDIKGL